MWAMFCVFPFPEIELYLCILKQYHLGAPIDVPSYGHVFDLFLF